MPLVQSWINDDDYNKYLVVKNKGKGAWTGFIHNALNGNALDAYMKAGGYPEFFISKKDLETQFGTKPIKTPEQAKKAVEAIPKDENWGGPLWKKGKK